MPNNILHTSVKNTRERFLQSKKHFDAVNDILPSRTDVSVGDIYQFEKAREIIRKSVAAVNEFHESCEVCIFTLDEVCRPLLDQKPDTHAIGAVARLMGEILDAMGKASTSVSISLNGIPFTDVGEASAGASVEAKTVAAFWETQYRLMPDHAQDVKRVQQEKENEAAEKLSSARSELLCILEADGWVTVEDLCIFLKATQREFGKIASPLLQSGQIKKASIDGAVRFALAATELPKTEPPKAEPKIEAPEPEGVQETFVLPPKKKSKKWIIAVAAVVVLIAAIVVGILITSKKREDEARRAEEQRQIELIQQYEAVIDKVETAVALGKAQKIEISEQEWSVLHEFEIYDIFNATVIRKAVAEKFSEFYRARDIDGMLEFTKFLKLNGGLAPISSWEMVFDVCFTKQYMEDLKAFVIEHGEFIETTATKRDVYSYGGYEIGFAPYGEKGYSERLAYIKVYLNQDDNEGLNYTYFILGDKQYRHYYHQILYKTDSIGYFDVGESVELVVDEMEVKTGDCHRCSGTGKVTGHFGPPWSSMPGYEYGKRCGLCDGTGWKGQSR